MHRHVLWRGSSRPTTRATAEGRGTQNNAILKVDISAMTAVHDIRPPGHQRGIALKSAFSSSCKRSAGHPLMRENKRATTATSSASNTWTKRTRSIARAATHRGNGVPRPSCCLGGSRSWCSALFLVVFRTSTRMSSTALDHASAAVPSIGAGRLKLPGGRSGHHMIRN